MLPKMEFNEDLDLIWKKICDETPKIKSWADECEKEEEEEEEEEKKNMTWSEKCRSIFPFNDSWIAACDRKKIEDLKISNENNTPVKKIILMKNVPRTPSPLRITMTFPVIDVETKKDTMIKLNIQRPVQICPKCNGKKKPQHEMCAICKFFSSQVNAKICPKCNGEKALHHALCWKCNYNCSQCGSPKSPRHAFCEKCAK